MLSLLNRFKQTMLAVPLVMLFFGMTASIASAAETWVPTNFDPNQHAYLDPGLKNHSRFPVSIAGLEQKLIDAGKAHNLKFYFVMTEQGTEPNGSTTGQKFGAWKLDTFVAAIQSKLPPDDYVIVMVVRSPSDPNKLSMAGQGGNRLQKYGLNANWFNASSGPLQSNRSVYLPNDPAGYSVAVASDVNQGVADHFARIKREEADRVANAERERQRQIAEAERARQNEIAEAERAKQKVIDDARRAQEWEAFKAVLPARIAGIGVPVGLVILIVVCLVMVSGARKRLKASIAAREGVFDNANTNYLEIRTSYLGFLQNNGTDWKSKFIGLTLKTYTEAVEKYAKLSANIQRALELLNDARRADKVTFMSPLKGVKVSGTFLVGAGIAAVVFFLVNWIAAVVVGGLAIAAAVLLATRHVLAALKKGYAVLETDKVTITGDMLPIEERDFFGSVVAETTYDNPGAMMDAMATLFKDTNDRLKAIKQGFDGAKQNRDDISGLTKKIDDSKPRLTAVELTFAPYEERFGTIKTDTDKFLQILASDPMSAFTASEAVEQAANDLVKEIDRAIGIKESLAQTRSTVKAAHDNVAKVRGQKADYTYPEKDAKPADGAAANTLLNEVGSNPDTILAEADERLAAAFAAVLAGKLDLSETEKKSATDKAAEATKLVEKVLAARAYVQKQVVPVRDNLKRLTDAKPGAETALETLKADFLAANFPGEESKIGNATRVIDKTEGELAKVRLAFFEQRYVAARALLEGIGGQVQGARDLLVEIHTKLAYLIERRAYAKKVVGQARQQADTLKGKLASHSHTTSKATDATYAGLVPTLGRQEQDVAKQVTDWPAACTAADSLLKQFQDVDSKIDAEKAAHALAETRLGELRSAVSAARTAVNHNDTRQPARAKLSEAEAALSEAERTIKVSKSDWAQLGRSAEQKKAIANEAKQMAETDQRLAGEARSAVRNAESEISRISARTWVQTAMWGGYSRAISLMGILDLSSARQALGQAQGYLHSRDYENAKDAASRASRSASDAENKADAALAAAVAQAIAEWQAIEAEKERQRREQERREQERRDQERREQERRDQERRDQERRDREQRDRDNDTSGRSGGGIDFGGGGRSGGGTGDF